jgi:transposase InsO family protein
MARRRDLRRFPGRKRFDLRIKEKIMRIWNENFRVYGVRKVWLQLEREGASAALCTVARLMRDMGLKGAVRDKKCFTTVSEDAAPRPPVLVGRKFAAQKPNQLWVAGFALQVGESSPFICGMKGFPWLRKVLKSSTNAGQIERSPGFPRGGPGFFSPGP